ncbi:FtsB family cell division protein [Tepidicaulis sp. LMO-SS28]|uniref:FtsB family cell division protein n=1 Tax=Tepidicaulis sp. LMO-SS28 TaxID=3447455 RepID=UPI003EE147E1
MSNIDLIRTREPLRLRYILLPVLGGLLALYFGYHAIMGGQGLQAYFENEQRIAGLQDQLDTRVATREQLDRHVALLRPESLDRDMLDERARAALGYARPDELTIFRDLR